MTHERSWRKSTRSNGQLDGACVEVSLAHDALVRDSKVAEGDVLTFSLASWQAFVAGVA